MPRVITTVDELGRMLYTMVMEEVGRKRTVGQNVCPDTTAVEERLDDRQGYDLSGLVLFFYREDRSIEQLRPDVVQVGRRTLGVHLAPPLEASDHLRL